MSLCSKLGRLSILYFFQDPSRVEFQVYSNVSLLASLKNIRLGLQCHLVLFTFACNLQQIKFCKIGPVRLSPETRYRHYHFVFLSTWDQSHKTFFGCNRRILAVSQSVFRRRKYIGQSNICEAVQSLPEWSSVRCSKFNLGFNYDNRLDYYLDYYYQKETFQLTDEK